MLELLAVLNPYVPRLSPQTNWREWSSKNVPVVFFGGFWEIQAKAATVFLLVFWEILGWEALLIMIGWAMLMTMVYELAIACGLEDLTKVSEKSIPSLGIRLPIVWLTVGWLPFIYTHLHQRVKNRSQSGLASKLMVAAGLVLFGVIPSRRLLVEEGIEKNRLKISLLGRFANVPFHLIETKSYLIAILFLWGTLENNALETSIRLVTF